MGADIARDVGAFSRVASTALDQAADRTVERLCRDRDSGGREAVIQTVGSLVRVLKGEAGLPPGGEAQDSLLRAAAATLEVELVRCWRSGLTSSSATEVLRQVGMLQDLECRAAGAPSSDPIIPENASRLDLVVEFAHDLRSPLTSILFLSETLRRGQSGELAPIQHRQLGIIYSAALNLVSLASDVIDLARGGDRLMDRPSQFSVPEMLESIYDMVAPLVEEKKVDVRISASALGVRRGYPVALSRVLLNLLSNALRYTSEGYVEITAQPVDANHVQFTVRDTGSGIGDEPVSGEFEPALKTTTDRRFGFSGSGLGLTICHRLLRAMDSELQCESAPGWGTRFQFRLHLPPAELT